VVRGGAQRLDTLAVVSQEPHFFSLAPCRHLCPFGGGWKRLEKMCLIFSEPLASFWFFLFAFVVPGDLVC
jgi:hypothetical protein